MPTTAELIANLEHVGEELAAFVEAQPSEALQRRPRPDEWTAAELIGHVVELAPYWSERAREVAERPGSPLGREADDASRLGGVKRLAHVDPVVGAAAVRGAVRQALGVLRQIPPDGWQATGRHRSGKDVTVAEVVERYIVNHIREHLDQARATVASVNRR